jgi:hypothetical protein
VGGSGQDSRLVRLLRGVVARRWSILAVYALIVPFALLLALRVPRDNSLERMIVASDPVVTTTREFQRVFPEPATAILMIETPDPLSPPIVEAVRGLQARLDRIPHVGTYSLLTIASRLGGAGHPSADDLQRLVARTAFFRRQGLAGADFLGVVVSLDTPGPAERDEALGLIDRAIAEGTAGVPQITRVRRVGTPWVDAWLERETAAATVRYFPLFGAFVVVLILGLYRSWRAVAVILACLGVAVLLGMAFAGIMGFAFTIVSALVPLTLMVTATASLVYLHSRYIDQPPGVDIEAHRVAALENKLVAVSASVFAAAVGFAALSISHIRPIRELGIWTAAGLALGWVVCFTLYPALQVILRAPTRQERRVVGGWVVRVAEVLPRWSHRWRWPLLLLFLALAAGGAVSLFGIPGALAPMRLQTDALDYVDPDLPIWKDTRAFGEKVLGLTSVKVWVTAPPGAVLDPGVLIGLDRLERGLERDPAVGSVVGLTAVLRLRRELAGEDAALPGDAAALERVAADLEQLLLQEPSLQAWVDMSTLGSTTLTVTARAGTEVSTQALEGAVRDAWARALAVTPGLARCSYRVVGTGVLQATISQHLVPTLVESFAITFGFIFVTFLLVFRSGAARLIAIVPSLFAILVTFLFMRVFGIPLNVATILIATTVLGATENDQIHFFYHYQERRNEHSTERSLAHAIRVAGHAIFFATLINAGGFLALILSGLPPMRQFGIITSLAFALAMVADFTALPAALWIFFRERPDAPPADTGAYQR